MNYLDYFNELQDYRDFAPTPFDCKGLNGERHGIENAKILLAHNRDSDCLTESNWNIALEMLGGESEAIQVHRFGHWASGWFELIIILPEAKEWQKIKAGEIVSSLEDYPVLDEMDFSERENDEASEVWQHCYSVPDRLDYIRAHREQFDFRDLGDILGCVRGNYFGGYASELIS